MVECDSCGEEKEDVGPVKDPYMWETHEIEEERNLCGDCYYERMMEI